VRGAALNADTMAEFASLRGITVGVDDGFEFSDNPGQHCGFCSAQPTTGAAR